MLTRDYTTNCLRAYEKKLKEIMGEEEFIDWCGANNCNYVTFIKMMEQQLKNLMGDEAFTQYVTELARMFFLAEVTSLPEGEFKEFCLTNFNMITE